MDEIEAKLLAEFPDVEILIHPDPEGHVDERGGRQGRAGRLGLASVAPVKLRDIGQPLHQRGAFRAVGLAQPHDGQVLIGRDDDILPQMADAGKDAGRAAEGNSSSLPSGWGGVAPDLRAIAGLRGAGLVMKWTQSLGTTCAPWTDPLGAGTRRTWPSRARWRGSCCRLPACRPRHIRPPPLHAQRLEQAGVEVVGHDLAAVAGSRLSVRARVAMSDRITLVAVE
jgi:hypothetical protein